MEHIQVIAELENPTDDPDGFRDNFTKTVAEIPNISLVSVSLGKVDEKETPAVTLETRPEVNQEDELTRRIDDEDARSLVSGQSFGMSTTKSRLCNNQDCEECGKPARAMPYGTGHHSNEEDNNRCPGSERVKLRTPCPKCQVWCSRKCSFGEKSNVHEVKCGNEKFLRYLPEEARTTFRMRPVLNYCQRPGCTEIATDVCRNTNCWMDRFAGCSSPFCHGCEQCCR